MMKDIVYFNCFYKIYFVGESKDLQTVSFFFSVVSLSTEEDDSEILDTL